LRVTVVLFRNGLVIEIARRIVVDTLRYLALFSTRFVLRERRGAHQQQRSQRKIVRISRSQSFQ
jgi:hypothetical protein